ncbi:hypothetical protein BDW74DRAFT_180045 [Aspergillus multicolor]|uniref:putative TFIIIC transcription initiation factor complex subunits Tfc3 n=1 Tax=Aspergillus multicolor TaxID=41759 RepID=UPI003CCCFDB5
MAPSLRDLIDFLLAEVALCGNQGASPTDILSYIDVFYAKYANEGSEHNPVIDRRFQEKVWQWLTKNPEVSVGNEREGNQLSLQEAERRQKAADADEKPISVFVSQERTWLAITGHEPDETKVLPMEFALLSIIASYRSAGVSQPDLIKLSGQDKRSVPKRTDILQQKGYIEKRAIQLRGARTSLCTLRKFLSEDAMTSTADTSDTGAVRMVDFNAFTDKLFGILREHQIIARNDLKNVLGFNDHWHWKVLSRALRKFERIGVVRRVRAMSQYANTMKKYHPCVMLVREPTAKDIERFHDFSMNWYADLGKGDDVEFEDEAEAEDLTGEATATEGIHAMEGEEASGRVLPIWSPDRSLHNQIFEVVDRAGTAGSSNSDVIRTFSGVLWRRPLENTLARLSECWQLSQPPYLRHLALVRDTALNRTITHYIHYSAENFGKLVEAGECSWEAVEFAPRNSKSSSIAVPPVDAKPQLDAYGLPQDIPTSDLVKNGDCCLSDCMWIVKPKDYNVSSSDPKAVKLSDGTYTIQYGIKGHNVPSPAGIRATPDTFSRLNASDEAISGIDTDEIATPAPKRPKKLKREPPDYSGMSKIERMKAMGYDESWTEYSVLLIDRQGPGVYVTPRGRRRPAGKERGRPPASRLAVFKSTKLANLPWFRAEDDNLDRSKPASQSPEPSTLSVSMLDGVGGNVTQASGGEEANVVHGTKRPHEQDSAGPELDSMPAKSSKLRRTGDSTNGSDISQEPARDENANEGKSEGPPAHEPQTSSNQGKRKRNLSPEIGHQDSIRVRKRGGRAARALQSSPATDGDGPKWSRRKPTGRQAHKSLEASVAATDDGEPTADVPASSPVPLGIESSVQETSNEDIPSASQPSAELPINEEVVPGTPRVGNGAPSVVGSGTVNRISNTTSKPLPARLQQSSKSAVSQTGTPASHATLTPETSSKRITRSKHVDKGGSVAFLRRKIVMDLVEKAGGAFPMGSDLWYPFVTAWMKTKYKERPDMRTLRTTVKHLVDAGKLRQQTFCGKDRKGVMVTKTVICKAELAPDDLFIKDMQKRILASETRHYFPPGVEVDPTLTKQGPLPKILKLPAEVPLESSLTVKLQNKPAMIQTMEKKKGVSIQRRLNRRLEIEQMRESMQEILPSGAVRLLSRLDTFMPPISGTELPGDDRTFGLLTKYGEKRHRLFSSRFGNRQLQRIYSALSMMAPYAMLMSPTQSFNPVNGTFSTDAGLANLSLSRAPQKNSKQVTMMRATLMLMNPYQSFNPSNGTFSTNAGLAALYMSRSIPRYGPARMPRKRDAHLPYSLDDQLMLAGRRNFHTPGETDSRSRDFIRDTNAILRWELQNEKILQERSEGIRYINHGIQGTFESAPLEGGIRFDAGHTDLMFDESASSARRARNWRQESGTFENPSYGFVSEGYPEFQQPVHFETMRMRRYKPPVPDRPRRLERLNETIASGNEPSSPRVPFRRNRIPQPFSRSSYRRLMIAIVAVRTLAGGSNGNIVDWPLISRCFPDQDPKLIQDKGKSFLARSRLQIAKMQYDFQERFVEAYANDQVPPIDYDNLEGYDWIAVIDWASATLDVPKSDRTPDLPATREQFDDIFELREENLVSLDELYQTTVQVTVNRKRALMANVAFAAPLPMKADNSLSQRRLELTRFEKTKTWVRANVFTPAEVYRAPDARHTLSHINEAHLSHALQTLVTERVISQANKGRMVPGRNYDMTDYFIQTLSKRRAVDAVEFRRASKFKTGTLDPALTKEGTHSVAFNAEDGDILALLNLFADGRVKFVPRDPPRDKFGLTEGGYLTRMMNKDKLHFPVDVYPVKGKYIAGNPTQKKASKIPPPSPPRVLIPTPIHGMAPGSITGTGTVSLPEKFPIWMDIHGGFIQVLWDLAIGAILGTLAVRPGVSAKRLATAIRPTMGDWEVLMVLEWLAEVGVVQKRSSDDVAGPLRVEPDTDEACWFVKEWWWMVLS